MAGIVKRKALKLLPLISSIMLLGAGCTVKQNFIEDDWYLRSEFTFWEAKDNYKFRLTNKDHDSYPNIKTYVLVTEILADGNPYHIKIADKEWSYDKNCGYESPTQTSLGLDTWLALNCSYDFKNDYITPIKTPIKFKPLKTAKYQFLFEINTVTNETKVKVEIYKDN